MGDLNKAFFNDLKTKWKQLDNNIEIQFKDLDEEQLNWRPAKGEWSVGECLSHIITINTKYLNKAEPKIKEGIKKKILARKEPKSSWMGKRFIKINDPNSSKKFKTPPVFQPTQEKVSAEIFDDYQKMKSRLWEAAESSENLDLNKIKVSSPVSFLIRFRLGDLFKILTAHEKRHLLQAQGVVKSIGFPENKKRKKTG